MPQLNYGENMFFIVTRENEDGSFDNAGMINRFSTSYYGTVKGLVKHIISDNWKKSGFRLEVFRNQYDNSLVDTLYFEAGEVL